MTEPDKESEEYQRWARMNPELCWEYWEEEANRLGKPITLLGYGTINPTTGKEAENG